MKPWTAVLGLVLTFAIFFAGCAPKEETIVTDFGKLLEQPLAAAQLRETGAYLDENLGSVKTETASSMVSLYEDLLVRYAAELPERNEWDELAMYFDAAAGRIDEGKLAGSERKSFLEDLTASNFRLAAFEGKMVLRVDYVALSQRFGSSVDPALVRLYELQAAVTDRPITENATLQVTYPRMLQRAKTAEALIRAFPDQELIRADALWIYTSHINAILMGATNSPIFDYKTGEFSPQARAAYEEYLREDPDSTLSWALLEYSTYLDSIGYRLDYSDKTASKVFFDTCGWLVSEAEKRVQK